MRARAAAWPSLRAIVAAAALAAPAVSDAEEPGVVILGVSEASAPAVFDFDSLVSGRQQIRATVLSKASGPLKVRVRLREFAFVGTCGEDCAQSELPASTQAEGNDCAPSHRDARASLCPCPSSQPTFLDEACLFDAPGWTTLAPGHSASIRLWLREGVLLEARRYDGQLVVEVEGKQALTRALSIAAPNAWRTAPLDEHLAGWAEGALIWLSSHFGARVTLGGGSLVLAGALLLGVLVVFRPVSRAVRAWRRFAGRPSPVTVAPVLDLRLEKPEDEPKVSAALTRELSDRLVASGVPLDGGRAAVPGGQIDADPLAQAITTLTQPAFKGLKLVLDVLTAINPRRVGYEARCVVRAGDQGWAKVRITAELVETVGMRTVPMPVADDYEPQALSKMADAIAFFLHTEVESSQPVWNRLPTLEAFRTCREASQAEREGGDENNQLAEAKYRAVLDLVPYNANIRLRLGARLEARAASCEAIREYVEAIRQWGDECIEVNYRLAATLSLTEPLAKEWMRFKADAVLDRRILEPLREYLATLDCPLDESGDDVLQASLRSAARTLLRGIEQSLVWDTILFRWLNSVLPLVDPNFTQQYYWLKWLNPRAQQSALRSARLIAHMVNLAGGDRPFDELVRDVGSCFGFAHRLGLVDWKVHYNGVCFYALAFGRAADARQQTLFLARARSHFKVVLDKGGEHLDFDWLRADPDLENLRGKMGFEALGHPQ